MKLLMIAVGNCEDENKQVHNQLFATESEVNIYIESKKIKEDYIVFDVYMGNYCANKEFNKNNYPIAKGSAFVLKNVIASTMTELNWLNELITEERPRDTMANTIRVLEATLKVFKEFFEAEKDEMKNDDLKKKELKAEQGSLF